MKHSPKSWSLALISAKPFYAYCALSARSVLAPILTVLLLTAVITRPVHATGMPVFDISVFGQSIITATNAARQVANQAMQIANEVRMIQNQIQTLQLIGAGRFAELLGNLGIQVDQLNAIMQTVRGVGYEISSIQSQFQNLFPAGEDWLNKPIGEYGDYFTRWSDQIHNATRTAMQGQALVENIRRHNMEAQHILMQSRAADGEVRQLQATNEMLSVLTNQLGDMTIAMTTSGRASASVAAAAQAERDAQREIVRRFTAPVTVPTNDGERF